MNHAFSKLRNRTALTELEIKQAMREVRIALLEADVNYAVAKDFISKVSEKAIGEHILKNLTSAQQVIKIVNDELIELMGSTHSKLGVSSSPPTVYMMCGLQGAGKTTMCGKLALMLKKQGKKPLLVACDVYRPAAVKQLQVVGKSVDVPVYEEGAGKPLKIAKHAIDEAKKKGCDTVIVDTAGRLHINEELMGELKDLKKLLTPEEILLVVDAMTGQDAVTVADSFNKDLDITGVILTKMDSDTRGGAALSIKAVCGKPVKLIGTGEKPTDLEPFHPERMASRILGMGDVLSLIEKAQDAITEEEAKRMEKKFKENSFNLEDYLMQFESMKKMGKLTDIMGMIPGMSRFKINEGDIDESKIEKNKAIIRSMTVKERRNPEILNGSRRKRIALGSGCTIQEVNQLIKQFEMTKNMMKQFQKGGKRGRLPFGF
ncbi:MAG: signal recognition particle protein [Clostridia bacterium]|nr:signal recognition particle protein [Clostridia bacterium]